MANIVFFDPYDVVVADRVTSYINSAHSPDYDGYMIINPDLSSISGVEQKYWVVNDWTYDEGSNTYDGYVEEMTQAEKDAVDDDDLPTLKAKRYAEIDARTNELIAQGFTFDGYVFSLSQNAQVRLMGINQVRSRPEIQYPIKWNNKNDTLALDIVDEDELLDMFMTAFDTYRDHVDSGTDLKDLIRDAEDADAVNAIVDNR